MKRKQRSRVKERKPGWRKNIQKKKGCSAKGAFEVIFL
jgi:hypothetical protein